MNAIAPLAASPAETGNPDRGIARWKGTIAGITAVLVGVPALVNAAYDIYATFANLPRTESERVNEALFRKYFMKQPIAEMPVPIKHSLGTVQARFAVFDEGDVFVEFGTQSQWFAFPRPGAKADRAHGLSLLPSAHAQSVPPAKPPQAVPRNRLYTQEGNVSGTTWYRTRIYEDGAVEKTEIDIRSGKVLKVDLSPPSRKPDPDTLARIAEPSTRIIPAPVIDLPGRAVHGR